MTEPTRTLEVPDPAVPTVADLFSPRARTILYLLSLMINAGMGIVAANVELHWGILAVLAAWNVFVSTVAVSNTPRLRGRDDIGAINNATLITVILVLGIAALAVHLIDRFF